jgi:hypothetical protein
MFGALLLAIPISSVACIYGYEEHHVVGSFTVEVRDWSGKPIPDLVVVLSPHQDEPTPGNQPARVETNGSGIAEFKGVANGVYELTTGISHGETLFIIVQDVQSKTPPDEWPHPVEHNVQLKWPDLRVLEVSRIAGRLSKDDGLPAHVHLALVDPLKQRELSAGETNSDGNFSLPAADPGLYLLQLKGDYLDGDIAIAVGPQFDTSNLDLALSLSTCGLMYGKPEACETHELQVANICGKVLDATGATVPRATVELNRTDSDKDFYRLIQVNSRDATFAISDLPPGEYSLLVSVPESSGFKMLIQPLRVLDGTGTPCSEQVKVTLAVSGSCSKAEIVPSH